MEKRNNSNNYVIGLDFGSLSARAVLTDVENGKIAAQAEYKYPHGIMYESLPDGVRLPPDWAVQDPEDWRAAMTELIKTVVRIGNIPPEQIIGIGIDTTASTVLALDSELVPMCENPKFNTHIHAWPKMWKHHAAFAESVQLTEAASSEEPELLNECGGKVGSELFLPKVLQAFNEDSELYYASETFMELGDWLVSLLIGKEARSKSMLCCKSLWNPKTGYPGRDFFKHIDSKLENMPEDKLACHSGVRPAICWPGEKTGTLCDKMAKELGLNTDTAVSAAQMDAYAGLPGSGISNPGELMMIVGTSTGYMLLSRENNKVPGVCAAVRDSNLPGFTNYAAGQSSVGDALDWFINNCVPCSYMLKAESEHKNIHDYLSELAFGKKAGENGLLASDWINGNKSILNNPALSGIVIGMTLNTKPEDIYRALMEATAFGARKIIENFEENGVPVNKIILCGGISQKNIFMMQMYADVLGRNIYVRNAEQTAALGSAVYAASAAGVNGGYAGILETVGAMTQSEEIVYMPDRNESEIYEKLYRNYLKLHDLFGYGKLDVMEDLRKIRNSVREMELAR